MRFPASCWEIRGRRKGGDHIQEFFWGGKDLEVVHVTFIHFVWTDFSHGTPGNCRGAWSCAQWGKGFDDYVILSQLVEHVFDCEETEDDLESCMKCWKDHQNCLKEAGYNQGVDGLWHFRNTPILPLPAAPCSIVLGPLWAYVNMSKSRIFPTGL